MREMGEGGEGEGGGVWDEFLPASSWLETLTFVLFSLLP